MWETWVRSWVWKIPWRRKWQPTPVFLPGGYHEQRSLVDYSPWGRRELYTTKQLAYIYLYIYEWTEWARLYWGSGYLAQSLWVLCAVEHHLVAKMPLTQPVDQGWIGLYGCLNTQEGVCSSWILLVTGHWFDGVCCDPSRVNWEVLGTWKFILCLPTYQTGVSCHFSSWFQPFL